MPLNGAVPADEVSPTDGVEPLSTVDVVKLLRPSVVHVGTESVAFGMFNQPIPQGGVGTGIVLDQEGHILTNNHVIDGAQRITVTLDSGDSFPATVVGRDERTDLAIIRIEAKDLQPAMLGISAETEVGEDVIAIGHALALRGGPTVSKGVVSALGRSIDTDGGVTIVDLIQTDTSINPGNSGGPLVNERGEVVGINTAIFRGSQGIGFAINIDDARVVVAQLIEKGFVRRGYLGIYTSNVTPGIASQRRLQVTEGVLIERVDTGTPADATGLRAGDVIVQLGDERVVNTGELVKFLVDHPPGETIEVIVNRSGVEASGEVMLGERPRQ